MNPESLLPLIPRPALKEPTGWFAAGQSFRKALSLLSDGAFKLFAHVCLEADRRTGRFEASHKELASALGKSKRIIGRYVAELEAGQICRVTAAARNQYARTTFEVCDAFWPYCRLETAEVSDELRQYVDSVRECFLSLGCTNGSFGAADQATAKDLYERRVSVGVVRDAMLMGALRKYSSWLNGTPSEPIQRLRYFESVIAEVLENALPPGYSSYLQRKLEGVAAAWTRTKSAPCATAATATASREEDDFSTDWQVLAQKGNQQTPS